ncbi:hypothetical protein MBLNU457_3126t1 [Dothideomycetes sp. NU457]
MIIAEAAQDGLERSLHVGRQSRQGSSVRVPRIALAINEDPSYHYNAGLHASRHSLVDEPLRRKEADTVKHPSQARTTSSGATLVIDRINKAPSSSRASDGTSLPSLGAWKERPPTPNNIGQPGKKKETDRNDAVTELRFVVPEEGISSIATSRSFPSRKRHSYLLSTTATAKAKAKAQQQQPLGYQPPHLDHDLEDLTCITVMNNNKEDYHLVWRMDDHLREMPKESKSENLEVCRGRTDEKNQYVQQQ